MFCSTCGNQIPDNARFCNACGAPVASQAAPAVASAAPAPVTPLAPAQPVQPASSSSAGTQLASYLQRVAARLQQDPQFVPELGAYLFLTTRFSAALTNMHQYFFVVADDSADYEKMRAYSEACTSWALANYQGVPRGLQKGIAIYPVMLQHPINPGVLRYVEEKPNIKYAAFQLATALDPIAGEIRYLQKTPVWGFAMWSGIKRAADEALCV